MLCMRIRTHCGRWYSVVWLVSHIIDAQSSLILSPKLIMDINFVAYHDPLISYWLLHS